MPIALILGLVAIAGSIAVGVHAAAAGNAATAEDAQSTPGSMAVPGRGERAVGGASDDAARWWARGDPDELPALLDRLRAIASRLTPHSYAERLQRRLDLAGNPAGWPAGRVLAFKGVGLVGGGLIGFVAFHGGITLVVFPMIGAVAGFFLPDVLLRNAGEKRQIEIRKGLPDVLDMMTVCVEAGLGFDAALSRVARNLDGPMAQECTRVLQEMQVGKSRTDALRALVARTDVTELRAFVSSLVQAAELGIAISVVLREQAKEMRIRRRQRAQEAAQKLPVKILLPLITCMLPAMFIVVLGPAMFNILDMLGSLNS